MLKFKICLYGHRIKLQIYAIHVVSFKYITFKYNGNDSQYQKYFINIDLIFAMVVVLCEVTGEEVIVLKHAIILLIYNLVIRATKIFFIFK